jgi:hypothetical protein
MLYLTGKYWCLQSSNQTAIIELLIVENTFIKDDRVEVHSTLWIDETGCDISRTYLPEVYAIWCNIFYDIIKNINNNNIVIIIILIIILLII